MSTQKNNKAAPKKATKKPHQIILDIDLTSTCWQSINSLEVKTNLAIDPDDSNVKRNEK
ncbi:16161_t:CDS:2, partial [Gigaspora rosea]